MSPPVLVLVTSRSFSTGDLDVAGELTAAGCQIVTGPADHDLEALTSLLASATAWIAGTGPVTAAHLDAAPQLQLVARYGVGVDAVDLAAAAERRVLVTNTPGANTGAVADHTLALMLAALRDIAPGDRGVRAGSWGVRRTRQLDHLTVGIIGLGRIGRGVATRLRGFGPALIGHDPWVPDDVFAALAVDAVGLDELARRSDVISLHIPGEEIVVDERFLSLTKPNLVLVNTARAHLVDEGALSRSLRAGRLRTYATDVLGSEAGRPDNPLLADDLIDRTLFTPHAGAQTVEAVDEMGRGAVDAVLAHVRGVQPSNLVRRPQSASGEAW